MKTFLSEAQRGHRPSNELVAGEIVPAMEQPERIDRVVEAMSEAGLGPIEAPGSIDRATLLRLHSDRYLTFLETAWSQWCARHGDVSEAWPLVWPSWGRPEQPPASIDGQLGFYSMDLLNPIGPNSWESAVASAASAVSGAGSLVRDAEPVFALCRPPGHHASLELAAGTCFLNNAALAADVLTDGGARVGVLDVDAHHGNGTQDLFYERADVFFASIHCDPDFDYPYFMGFPDETGRAAGEGFNLNLTVPFQAQWSDYEPALETARRALTDYDPDYLVVSLGVDSYVDDKLGNLSLRSDDYARIGSVIGQLAKPTLFVFEGGYHMETVGQNTVRVLTTFLDP